MIDSSLIAVGTFPDPESAPAVAEALLTGGVRAIEITLRTPSALNALEAIASRFPDMKAGAGTVLRKEQVDQVISAGAEFAVAPGLNPSVVRYAQEKGLPFAPGVMTPGEVELSLDLGCLIQKFFPSELAGGLEMLTALAGPYGHTGVKFIPLGGVNRSNLVEYLSHPAVYAVGGSWLLNPDDLKAKNWSAITRTAKEAADLASGIR